MLQLQAFSRNRGLDLSLCQPQFKPSFSHHTQTTTTPSPTTITTPLSKSLLLFESFIYSNNAQNWGSKKLTQTSTQIWAQVAAKAKIQICLPVRMKNWSWINSWALDPSVFPSVSMTVNTINFELTMYTIFSYYFCLQEGMKTRGGIKHTDTPLPFSFC